MIHTLDLTKAISDHASRFHTIEDLLPLLEEASKAKYVLLGESTHGTSEFYSIRADISKWLIAHKGFQFIAVEGDWPSCYEVNRYIKSFSPTYKKATDALQAFRRWPRWMWANEEIIPLLDWLKQHNNEKARKQKVGFHGIDVYSLWESMTEIVTYLEKIQSPYIEKAKEAFVCFEPYHKEMQLYGVSSTFYGQDCFEELVNLLESLHQNRHMNMNDDEAELNLKINALAVENAERYYRTMVTNDSESWNIRDEHMVEALDELSNYYGKEAKGIVWEHNTHIGDARATDMASVGMVNVGQLTREKYGANEVYAIGFGTYEGSVIAGTKWGEPAQTMSVPKAVSGSFEDQLHQAGAYNKFIMFNETNQKLFSNTIGHWAIGVVYNSQYEHLGNYVPSRISDRYNAFIHVDQSKALTPLQ
ncbi:erythromycin esterase family protein [Alkalihalobacillus sp. MEB130]|uniref:erythromycin esterase family protein n=1 Tax=Alkalihalobacillus sp. MEB130 TaxID=2976704 RepID=UPI0028E04EAD|nr:erythromycin esterase family protein [Alkalihalobacillus sp. MEB130]MDT8859917.1 erythromycin esterase family protein [Alkalihalobacillus sp. MEB130]